MSHQIRNDLSTGDIAGLQATHRRQARELRNLHHSEPKDQDPIYDRGWWVLLVLWVMFVAWQLLREGVL